MVVRGLRSRWRARGYSLIVTDWLFELSIGIEPEDGSLCVYGVGDDGTPALTRDGIDNLREIIADQRAAGKGPPVKPLK